MITQRYASEQSSCDTAVLTSVARVSAPRITPSYIGRCTEDVKYRLQWLYSAYLEHQPSNGRPCLHRSGHLYPSKSERRISAHVLDVYMQFYPPALSRRLKAIVKIDYLLHSSKEKPPRGISVSTAPAILIHAANYSK